jgi:hypothetical protein
MGGGVGRNGAAEIHFALQPCRVWWQRFLVQGEGEMEIRCEVRWMDGKADRQYHARYRCTVKAS